MDFSFKDLFQHKHVHTVGIDISSTSVKLLELSQHGSSYRVEAYGVAALPQEAVVENDIKDIEAVGEAIKLVVGRSRTQCKFAATAVPSSSVITKIIQMDASLDDHDMETQVSLEAGRYIPYPLEEVSLDFEILGYNEKDESKVDVLIAASRSENVDVRIDAVAEGELTTKIIDVESYALERTFPLIADQLPNKGIDKTIAVVDIGSTMTTITILHNLKTIYSREEVFGGKQLTEAIQRRYGLTFEEAGIAKKEGGLADDYIPEVLDPFREALVPLIRRSLQFFFSASRFNSVDHIIWAGGGAMIPGLHDLIKERLEVESSVANPFADMTLANKVDAAQLSADAPSLMVCCGLALRSFAHANY
ncbi:MAG: pilus assembly protein PilM [Legionellales bacterium]|nr:pilus assembly protein PilM [Legionellales bacterium]|tara:strand:+ start:15028 stop:16116 length:1089 start_codon:yes stop_codon:yes gene_type:complete